ncbi:hypothetical protein HKL94_01860 [Candidatus Parcubacteria bacterium]|nr:hypothetical protein [Candidatus Parcubacteria bacterium]
MANRKILGIVAVIIIILGGWYVLRKTSSQTPTATTQIPVAQATATTSRVTIDYTDHGFSPRNTAIPFGTTVIFMNQSSNKMWVASDPHPTHQGYDGTTESQHCALGYTGPAPFDQCSVGTSFSFTFLRAGTWGYHNHKAPEDQGSITVAPPMPI